MATEHKITTDILKGAQPRVPKGWKKVLLVHAASLGVELHGQSDTVAVVKAVRRSMEEVSVPCILDDVPGGIENARAKVKVAVPFPKGVDKSKIMDIIPLKESNVEIKVVRGGLSFNSGLIVPELGDPPPEKVPENVESDDEVEVAAPDQYKVAVAAIRIGY